MVLQSLIPLSLFLAVVASSGLAAAVVPLLLISKTLEIFATFFNFYSNENWNRSVTFSDLSQWCLSYHLS